MEPKDKSNNDILDTVITDCLREQYGAGPSRAVWGRILNEITPVPEVPVVQRRWDWLRDWFQGPIARTAFIFTLLLVLVGKPALAEYTRVAHRVAYPDVTMVLPTVPQQRPLPQQDLQSQDSRTSQRSERLEAEARQVGVPLPQIRIAELP
jgi:hypothetical protein